MCVRVFCISIISHTSLIFTFPFPLSSLGFDGLPDLSDIPLHVPLLLCTDSALGALPSLASLGWGVDCEGRWRLSVFCLAAILDHRASRCHTERGKCIFNGRVPSKTFCSLRHVITMHARLANKASSKLGERRKEAAVCRNTHYTHTHTQTHTCTHTHVDTRTCSHSHTRTRAHIHTDIDAHVFSHTHTRTQTHTGTGGARRNSGKSPKQGSILQQTPFLKPTLECIKYMIPV